MAKGEVDLRVENGARVDALEIRDFKLTLPSGLVILLKNCYYVPTMSRNIIFVSCLDIVMIRCGPMTGVRGEPSMGARPISYKPR